jgi:hypothetical protein
MSRPLPPRLQRLRDRIRGGNYAGLAADEQYLFGWADALGLDATALLRSWTGGDSVAAREEADDAEDADDAEEASECMCDCEGCSEGRCEDCEYTAETCLDRENCQGHGDEDQDQDQDEDEDRDRDQDDLD